MKCRLVIDTNVVVSSFLRPDSKPGQVLDQFYRDRVGVIVEDRILDEYRDVLTRPHLKLDPFLVDEFLALVEANGEHVRAQRLLLPLPDEKDRPFIEVAVEARADALITGNVRHFPPEVMAGVPVHTPATWLAAQA